MSDEPPTLPTFEQLSTMPKSDLIDRTNSYLKLSEKATNAAFFPLRARIFMQELERRDQDRQTRRMLDHTKAVTIMTFVITVMTFIQVWPSKGG